MIYWLSGMISTRCPSSTLVRLPMFSPIYSAEEPLYLLDFAFAAINCYKSYSPTAAKFAIMLISNRR